MFKDLPEGQTHYVGDGCKPPHPAKPIIAIKENMKNESTIYNVFGGNNKKFDYKHYETQEEVRKYIQGCEGHHKQQAIYSTFHDGLTQVCFGCRCIRSTIIV